MAMNPQRGILEALLAQQRQIPRNLMPQGGQPVMPGFEMLGQPGGSALPSGAPSPVAAALMRPGTVQMPIGRGGETKTLPSTSEGPDQVNGWVPHGRIIKRALNDPMGAIGGALQFFGAGAGSNAMATGTRTAANPVNRALAQREMRSVTESGAAKNRAEDLALGYSRDAERIKEVTDLKDWAKLPAHVLQEPNRNPTTGRFGKLSDGVKAQREQGRRRMEIERRLEKRREVDDDGNVWYRGMLDDAP